MESTKHARVEWSEYDGGWRWQAFDLEDGVMQDRDGDAGVLMLSRQATPSEVGYATMGEADAIIAVVTALDGSSHTFGGDTPAP